MTTQIFNKNYFILVYSVFTVLNILISSFCMYMYVEL